jgi:hypothetical protein
LNQMKQIIAYSLPGGEKPSPLEPHQWALQGLGGANEKCRRLVAKSADYRRNPKTDNHVCIICRKCGEITTRYYLTLLFSELS